VYEVAQKRSDAEFELVDIKDFNLPLPEEPVPAIRGQHSKPHTKAWADMSLVNPVTRTEKSPCEFGTETGAQIRTMIERERNTKCYPTIRN
jgi:hypothetical protein